MDMASEYKLEGETGQLVPQREKLLSRGDMEGHLSGKEEGVGVTPGMKQGLHWLAYEEEGGDHHVWLGQVLHDEMTMR